MNKPAIIVISSHVARGSVGNRAAVFALETLGFPVWAVPTILLPWHPGHGLATRIVPPTDMFDQFMNDLANAPWIDEVSAVLTGYMANPEQVSSAARLVQTLKHKNPELIHLCDPVIGDVNGLYVTDKTADAIRDEFLAICDIVTPNRFELAWLCREPEIENLEHMIGFAKQLQPETVLATSSFAADPKETGNYLKTSDAALLASHKSVENPPNGPGDLTASLFLGHWLASMSQEDNLRLTTASVLEILTHATGRGSDELTLESNAASLINPKVELTITAIGETQWAE